MNRFTLTIVGLVLLHKLYAQYFTGEVVYSIKTIPRPGVNADSLVHSQPGDTSVYLIGDRHYKSSYFRDGKPTYSYTFHDETKRMYDEEEGKPYITWRDSRKGDHTMVRSTIYKDSSTVILGHPCYMVEYIYRDHVSKTYYTDNIRINYEAFKGHEVGNWYQIMKEVNGSFGMRTVTIYPTHTEVQEVTEMKQRDVKHGEFDLPSSKPVVASFSALDSQVEMREPTDRLINCYRYNLQKAPELHGRTKSHTVYVRFMLSDKGEIQMVSAVGNDEYGLHKLAVEIITTCGFEFTTGTIENKPVSCEVYFPIEFLL